MGRYDGQGRDIWCKGHEKKGILYHDLYLALGEGTG